VVLTKEGYIKRLPLNEFVIQGRGGVGKSGAKLASDSDEVSQFFVCNDLDHILFATSR
jgi:DNA gyrase subunit A